MDVALQAKDIVDIEPLGVGFNPCFSGCSSSRSAETVPRLQSSRVSILVLVDVALQVDEVAYTRHAGKKFQSLF